MTSPTPNAELMAQARVSLADKWHAAALATFVYILIVGIVQVVPVLGLIISLAISGPMIVGFTAYMLSVSRGGSPDIQVVFSQFSNFVKTLLLYLLSTIIIMVGMILLIIPGIIASLALAMSYFVMVDNPNMGVVEAATASYNMMNGNKWKLFCLYCRFIGWAILCCFTLGIGFLWLLPYIMVSSSKFYDEIKGDAVAAPAPLNA